jgi:hypothetical protein
MSITTHPHRFFPVPEVEPSLDPNRPLGRTVVRALVRLVSVLRAAFRTTATRAPVLAARLIGWFAAEPKRIQATFLGVMASVATGIIAGAIAGVAVVRAVTLMLGVVRGP